MGGQEVEEGDNTGVGVVARNYINIEIKGTWDKGSLDNMSEDLKKKYKNHEVENTGWLFGSYKS